MGDSPTKSRSQFSGWCRSAKPPSISERMKFSVSAARSYPRSMSVGSGSRSSAAERAAIHQVAPKAGQRSAIANFLVRAAGFGVLSGHSAQPDHGLLQPDHQYQGHLQQDLELFDDDFRLAFVEALRAVAPLEQESLTSLCPRQLRLELLDFPAGNQRREPGKFAQRLFQTSRVPVKRLLAGLASLPTRGAPIQFCLCLYHRGATIHPSPARKKPSRQ